MPLTQKLARLLFTFVISLDAFAAEMIVGEKSLVSLSTPDDWETYVHQVGQVSAPTFEAITSQDDGLQLLISAIPLEEKHNRLQRKQQLDRLLRNVRSQYFRQREVRQVSENQVPLSNVKGVGHLYTFVDESLLNGWSLPPGEYIYASSGGIVTEQMLLTVSILTNNLETQSYRDALDAVRSLSVSEYRPKPNAWETENVVMVPGEDWGFRFVSPKFTDEDGLEIPSGYQFRASADGGFAISIFVEPSGDIADDPGSCREQYWLHASRNPMIERESIDIQDGKTFSTVNYRIGADVGGRRFIQHHVNYYGYRDDYCIDVHISKAFLDSERDDGILRRFEETLDYTDGR